MVDILRLGSTNSDIETLVDLLSQVHDQNDALYARRKVTGLLSIRRRNMTNHIIDIKLDSVNNLIGIRANILLLSREPKTMTNSINLKLSTLNSKDLRMPTNS